MSKARENLNKLETSEWTGSKYKAGSIVTYNGSTYVALQDNDNSEPDINPADWRKLSNEDESITSIADSGTGADRIKSAVSLTQQEYNAITTPDPDTIYFIVG
jgi:hypothetical protein